MSAKGKRRERVRAREAKAFHGGEIGWSGPLGYVLPYREPSHPTTVQAKGHERGECEDADCYAHSNDKEIDR